MWIRKSLLAYSVCFQAFTLAQLAVSGAGVKGEIANNYIVVFKQSAGGDAIRAHSERITPLFAENPEFQGIKKSYDLGPSFRAYSVECSAKTLEEILKSPEVDVVEQDRLADVQLPKPTQSPLAGSSPTGTVDPEGDKTVKKRDTQTDAPWGLRRMSNKGWKSDDKGRHKLLWYRSGWNSTLYLFDTGLRGYHEDIHGNRGKCGIDLMGPGTTCVDNHGHGTHAASVVGGLKFGLARRSWMFSVRVFDNEGKLGSLATLLEGFQWVSEDYPNRVRPSRCTIYLPVVFPEQVESVNRAVDAMVKQGIVVVVPAGNSKTDASKFSPGSVETVVTVGAITKFDTLTSTTNLGKAVDIYAPGEAILGAGHTCGSCTGYLSGTTMAAAYVAGLAAYFQSAPEIGLSDKPPAVIADYMYNIAEQDKLRLYPETHPKNDRIAQNGFAQTE